MELKFRNLRADELEARVATVSKKGCSVLIYKDARCDMRVLDETVGAMNWMRDHKEIKGNVYCGVGIYDTEKEAWIWKWDCGTESYTEKEKGESSDSFKRACFNWSLGRSLYSCPFIWFNANQINLEPKGQGYTTYDRFQVDAIEYDGDRVSFIQVSNQKTGSLFTWGKSKQGRRNVNDRITDEQLMILREMIKKYGTDPQMLCDFYGVPSINHLTQMNYVDACKRLSVSA